MGVGCLIVVKNDFSLFSGENHRGKLGRNARFEDQLLPTNLAWIIHACDAKNLLNLNSIAAEKVRFSYFIVIAFLDFFPTLSLKFNFVL